MYTGDTNCHSSSCRVDVNAQLAFDYLSDGVAQGDWTLGSMNRKKIGDDLYSGISIFNGAELYIRIDADPSRFCIYYHVGLDQDNLQPRNMVRVLPGSVLDRTDDECLVTLLTWRSSSADDDKWKLTCVSHETEMFIIKNRLEQG
jgi:hypothetical protein